MVSDIWGFAESTEKPIRVHGRKPQISDTAKVRSKFTLRERLQETPKPHSGNPIISPELIENLQISNLIRMITWCEHWGHRGGLNLVQNFYYQFLIIMPSYLLICGRPPFHTMLLRRIVIIQCLVKIRFYEGLAADM